VATVTELTNVPPPPPPPPPQAEEIRTLQAEVARLETQNANVTELNMQLMSQVEELTSQVEVKTFQYETMVDSIPTAPVSTVPWNMVTMKAFWRADRHLSLGDGFYRGIATNGMTHGIDRCPSGFRFLSEAECRDVATNTPPTSLMDAADCAEHCDHNLPSSSTRFQYTTDSYDPMGCFFYPPFGFYWRSPPSLTSITAGPTRPLRSPICKKEDSCLKYSWVAGVYTCTLSSNDI